MFNWNIHVLNFSEQHDKGFPEHFRKSTWKFILFWKHLIETETESNDNWQVDQEDLDVALHHSEEHVDVFVE